MSPAGAALVTGLVVLGLVVVLPLGLRLLGPDVVPAPGSVAWPLAGVAGAASLLLPRGAVSVALALVLAAATAVLVGAAARLVAREVRSLVRGAGRPDGRRAGPGAPSGPTTASSTGARLASRAATATALVMPAVGACALVAERAGWGLLGFSGTYLALTVPHMLYAGFGAALVAGTVVRLAATDRLAVTGAWGVPLGTVLVLVGYFVGDVAELVGAVVLTLALWATAVAAVRSLAGPVRPAGHPDARPGHRHVASPAAARVLLGTGAVVVGVSMLLALWWAAGEALGFAHPSLDVMAATHGVANALGFVLCTLLGLRVLVATGPAPSIGTPAAAVERCDEHDARAQDTRPGPAEGSEGRAA